MMRRFPWEAFMRAGLGLLRLSPEAFWAATPREIAAAFPREGSGPPERAAIHALMNKFPDEA
jgi:uncharacterized phage protein (TIGR02216 family)